MTIGLFIKIRIFLEDFMNNNNKNNKYVFNDKKINNAIEDNFETEGVSTILGDPKKLY